MLEGILYVVLVVDSLFLMLLVLIQSGTGGGLASTFGGGSEESLLGSRGSQTLSRWTSITACTFFVLCCVLAYLSGRREESVTSELPGRPKAGEVGVNATSGEQPLTPAAPESEKGPQTSPAPKDDAPKTEKPEAGTGGEETGERAGEGEVTDDTAKPTTKTGEPPGTAAEPPAEKTDTKKPEPEDEKALEPGKDEATTKPEGDLKSNE
jgi:preprotein translocase subunit SecG